MAQRKSKSSGMRMLWIPGGRKSHPKGRFDSTSKQISYSTKQKKSEVWSLGGSKTQKDFINAEPQTALLDGPSSSGLAPATCALGIVGATAQCATTNVDVEASKENIEATVNNLPQTPNSTTSTVPLNAIPNSPTESQLPTMPAKTTNVAVPTTTTTTKAEIIDKENRFSILDQENAYDFDIYALPAPPKDDLNNRDNLVLSISAEGTMATTPASIKSDAEDDTKDKQKLHPQNHNNNNHQVDVNSIESISEHSLIPLQTDLEWIDELYLQRNGNSMMHKNKHKKKKKNVTATDMDQLDAVPSKPSPRSEPSTDEDEKVVKCLYYTLMCCDCTIS